MLLLVSTYFVIFLCESNITFFARNYDDFARNSM
jgi:hypothetical protein